jgi:photosystem II stability/assembly factor-like uncharacterized protein
MNRRLPARLLIPVIGILVCLLWVGVHAQAPRQQRPAPAPGQQQPQPPQPQPRPGQEQERVAQQTPSLPPPINVADDPLLAPFRFRSIGPASMGGRIDDFAVVNSDPSTIYIGFATGGVWKTVNNGITWTPIFDTYSVCSIGAIAVDQKNPNVLWVGTGEANNRQSSSFGDGIYKSTDGGKTFTHLGLKETQSIARIVVDPKDSNIVYVAALGHLFGPNPERGVYKTADGGKTWNAIKVIDADTGFTDLVMDPADPKTLYAASYQRRRVPWGFNGGGPGSGIWKTTDAGKSWTRLDGGGLPAGLLGRIGLAVSASNPKVVYAQIEVGASAGTGGNVTADGKPLDPSAGRGGAGAGAGGGGRGGQQANQPPPPPDPKKSGVWRSDDKGKTWRVVGNNNDRPMYYSQIRVDPINPEIVYTMGAPFHKSVDGGKTFKVVQGIAHSDHHGMWIDPKNPKHLVLGNDGGLDVSYDQGDTWEFVNTMAVGQFYAVSADMRKPYWVCGGLQDNGSWCGPSGTRSTLGILNSHWFRIGGGDGFYTQQDPTDYNVIFVESQDGNVQRLDLRTGRPVNVRPRAAARPRQQAPGAGGETQPGEQAMAALAAQMGFGQPPTSNIVPPPPEGEQFRFFWNTPILLSPHNPRTVYIGANQFFRSFNRGDTYLASPDLTKNISRFTRPIMNMAGDGPMASKHDGAGAFSSIVTISESPVMPGVIWVGTNDGNVQVTRDGGATWKNVADAVAGAPKEAHISRVEASHFDAGTCYVSFDNHRVDDLKPYLYVTRDYGATWKSVAGNLPQWGNVNVVREDLKNRNLLFAGTEFGLYVSLNGGAEWKRFMNGMPVVRIDDILIHPRDNDLIVGTHGRSIYILDDITPLQQLSEKVTASDVFLFDVRPGVALATDVTLTQSIGGAKHFRGENPQAGTAISYYLKAAVQGEVKITISDYSGRVIRTLDGSKTAGLNRVQWNLRGTPPPRPAGGGGFGGGGFGGAAAGPALDPGTYVLKLSVDGKDYTSKVVIEADDFGKQ